MSKLIAFIDGYGGLLYITFVDETTGKSSTKIQFLAIKLFIDKIPAMFNPAKCKAVIINTCYVQPIEYSNIYEFRQAIIDRLNQMGLPNYYISKTDFFQAQSLVAAKVAVDIGDTVLIVMSKDSDVIVTELQRTSNGYEHMRNNILRNVQNFPPEFVRNSIMGSAKPKKIILSSGSFGTSSPKFLRQLLRSKGLVVVDRQEFIDVAIMEVYKTLADKNYVKYKILPTCTNTYELGFKYGSTKHQKIVADLHEKVPFSKTVHVPKSSLEFYMSFHHPLFVETHQIDTFLLKQNAHRNKITLKVNELNIPSYQIKPVILDGVKKLPTKLNEYDGKKIPVIGFYDDSSVICIPNDDDNEYQFLDKWNGMYGKQLLIAFDKEKPTFYDQAAEAYRKKPAFVVSDLITIMSRSPEEQVTTAEFKITKDAENPILLEFRNHGGVKKAASPAFLMAMHLKEHIKAIKAETSVKPTEIGFCFVTQKSDDEKKERIVKHLEESCEMLKVECTIINV